MQKITDRIYQIFGIIFLISFFLTIITAVFFKRVNFNQHSFNVPAFFASLLFISLFVIFTFTPSWQKSSKSLIGAKKNLASLLILLISLITTYFGIYLPFTSRLLLEIPNQIINQSEPIIFIAQSDKKYYIETDSAYIIDGTKIKINISNNEWSDNFTFTVGEKKPNETRKNTYGTSIVFLPFSFPKNETYKMNIKLENNKSSVRKLRLFEK